LAERHPECAVGVVEGRPGSLLLEHSNLLPQRDVFNHEVGSPPTHRPDRAGAKRHEDDENTEHDAAEFALSRA